MLVQQILNSKSDQAVVTVSPGTLISEAAKILAEKRIGTVIVSKSGQTADGILSERDIVRELAARGATCLSDAVSDYMTSELKTASREDNVDTVLATMTAGRFRHMPVIDDGALVGIVTLGDVVKAKLSEVAMEKDALEGMIMGH
ncbi:CBS domain-containing protein [Primorskyibacter sp. S187A]|uniref:CBS domain-containing protein n=1 Tax=Primorskyibacter sp. S187A TaxID=3415130 RepID=UPI003C79B41A